MEIREARPDDNEVLKALQARIEFGDSVVFRRVVRHDFFNRSKTHNSGKVFVACEGDDILGTAAVAIRQGTVGGKLRKIAYQYQLFVSPDHRRKGVARGLSEKRRQYIEAQTVDICYLITEQSNPVVKRLVESEGFIRYRRLVNRGRIVTEKVDVSGIGSLRQYEESDSASLITLVNNTWAGHDLYEPLTEVSLRDRIERCRVVGLDNLFLLEKEGEIAACLGVGNRSHNESLMAVSVDPRLRENAQWAPEPGQELPPALGFGLIGYRNRSDLCTILQLLNNRLAGQGPTYGFLIHDESCNPVPEMNGFFQMNNISDMYVLSLNDEVNLSSPPEETAPAASPATVHTPVFVDPLEVF